MSEDFLDVVDIRAVFQQVRRKGVAQRMRRDVLIDLRAFGILLEQLPKAPDGSSGRR